MSDRLEAIGEIAYTASAGDTFDSLALDAYDDERLASAIAEANPELASVLVFEGGEAVSIPVFSEVEVPDTLPPWRR